MTKARTCDRQSVLCWLPHVGHMSMTVAERCLGVVVQTWPGHGAHGVHGEPMSARVSANTHLNEKGATKCKLYVAALTYVALLHTEFMQCETFLLVTWPSKCHQVWRTMGRRWRSHGLHECNKSLARPVALSIGRSSVQPPSTHSSTHNQVHGRPVC